MAEPQTKMAGITLWERLRSHESKVAIGGGLLAAALDLMIASAPETLGPFLGLIAVFRATAVALFATAAILFFLWVAKIREQTEATGKQLSESMQGMEGRITNFSESLAKSATQGILEQIDDRLSSSLENTPFDKFLAALTQKEEAQIHFRDEVRSFADTLIDNEVSVYPAIEICAQRAVQDLRKLLSQLTHPDVLSPVHAEDQINMARSLSTEAKESIIFIDPNIYDNIDAQWSALFHTYIRDLKKKNVKKICYIVFKDGSHFKEKIKSMACYVETMSAAGFELRYVREVDFKRKEMKEELKNRIEIFDEEAVLKVELRSSYSGLDEIPVTVTSAQRSPLLAQLISHIRDTGLTVQSPLSIG